MLGQGRGVGPRRDNCSHFPSRPHPAPPSHSQAHGAAPQGARLPLQGGADDEVREQKEGPVLLAADCLLWGPRQDSGRGPPSCPQCPGDSQAQGGVRTLPQLPRGGGRGRVGTRPGGPVGAQEQGQPWAAGTSRRVNEAGWERGQARGQQDTSYHFNDHLLPQEPPLWGLELWDRRYRCLAGNYESSSHSQTLWARPVEATPIPPPDAVRPQTHG